MSELIIQWVFNHVGYLGAQLIIERLSIAIALQECFELVGCDEQHTLVQVTSQRSSMAL